MLTTCPLYVGQSGPLGLVTVGRGPREVDVLFVKLVAELGVLEPVMVMLSETVAVEEAISVDAAVELIVDTALENRIGGALAPMTIMAASDRSSPPLFTTPILVLSMH
jgi:hypothetical protein